MAGTRSSPQPSANVSLIRQGDFNATAAAIEGLILNYNRMANLLNSLTGQGDSGFMEIDGAVLGDLSVTDAKIASLAVDKLTAGTIDASIITVINIDAGNITTGTLNAARIGAGSIEVGKLVLRLFYTTCVFSNGPATAITWTSGLVYYNGTPYSITGSNTTAQYIWWNVGDSAFSVGAAFTAAPNRFQVAVNISGTGQEVWQQLGGKAITTSMLADLAVGTNQLDNLAVTDAKILTLTASKLTAGTIDAAVINVINLNAANITTGTLNAARVGAASIDTTKLTIRRIMVVGTFTNNSPSAGRIAWSSVFVYFAGASYTITNGNTTTAQTVVYWDLGSSTFGVGTPGSIAVQKNRYIIALNESGVANEVWDNIYGGATIQEDNLAFGLISGVNPQRATTGIIRNGADQTPLVLSLAGQSGVLISIGVYVVTTLGAAPAIGALSFLISIDGSPFYAEQVYAGNTFFTLARPICQMLSGAGGASGDFISIPMNIGFDSSIQIYGDLLDSGLTGQFSLVVRYAVKT